MDMTLVPYVLEQTSRGERSYDIFSRLLNDRIIMLNDEVNSASAGVIIAQMLYLELAGEDFHARVNNAFLELAQENPERIRVIESDSRRSITSAISKSPLSSAIRE